MESTIPAAIVAAILMVSSVLLARAGHQSFDDLGQAWKAMEVRAGEQARTQLTITGTTRVSAGLLLDVDLLNNGNTRVADFSQMDVVLEYEVSGGGGSTVIVWLPYTAGPVADNTWVVSAIVDDTYDPGVLNPGETMQMRIQLNPNVAKPSTNRITIGTELGVTASTTFTF
jgi:archaellum component FlaF (FlaF/FlaG flagellin family)